MLSFIRSIGRVPLHQLFVVTLVGVTSGVYIYKPLLERYANEHGLNKKHKEDSSTTVKAEKADVVVEVKSSTPAQKQDGPSEHITQEKGKDEKASPK